MLNMFASDWLIGEYVYLMNFAKTQNESLNNSQKMKKIEKTFLGRDKVKEKTQILWY